jgi:hypothetical protein
MSEGGTTRTRAEAVWIALGAMVGGFITASFNLEPTWLWAMAGGGGGGATAALAAYVANRPLSRPLRLLSAAAVLVVGFFAIWLIAGRQYITDPANMQVRPPGVQ